jgi:hypothetical protein
MATMLDVDGKEFKEPTESDIAIAFDAIEKRTGFFHGGISLVTLTIEAVGSLTAAGHPAEGFSLSYNDGSPDHEYFSSETLPIDEVVKIFQMYARRDDWGKARFKWEQLETLDTKTQCKRLLWILCMATIAYLIIHFLTKEG